MISTLEKTSGFAVIIAIITGVLLVSFGFFWATEFILSYFNPNIG